ncbi:cupredoxin domain-containing protein [Rhizosphaericola mali]|uniref:Cytochrome C oxidase subunit II n=1 Tax=Rhizosphaericola mali TaxID=2545455 RepID=A0A5P2G6F6_9BACT|nr:cytochrome C oxidase subunit II [Rhizosphaericola mali]QES89370.1 cytochrome C oxidase subunit II [Rhizosphaericola mali]
MNKYEQRIILITGCLMGLFLFAILYNVFSRKIDVPACTPFSTNYEKPQVKKVDSLRYEIYAIAHMWTFEPSDISVPAGSTVDLYLTSTDVVHGFDIARKDINLMAVPGGVTKKTIHFDEPGVYHVVCHEYCGAGHQNMMGDIKVTYK